MLSGRHVIRLGDPTTHGGVVVSASGTVTINGKRVARKGDHVTCPLPGHGAVTIIEGDSLLTDDGKPIALEGHKCSCGCSLISTLSTFVRSDEGGGAGIAGAVGSAAAAMASAVAAKSWQKATSNERFDEHFVVLDQSSGAPATGFAYGVKSNIGEHHDALYDDGATVKAYSKSPVSVELLYAAQQEIGLR